MNSLYKDLSFNDKNDIVKYIKDWAIKHNYSDIPVHNKEFKIRRGSWNDVILISNDNSSKAFVNFFIPANRKPVPTMTSAIGWILYSPKYKTYYGSHYHHDDNENMLAANVFTKRETAINHLFSGEKILKGYQLRKVKMELLDDENLLTDEENKLYQEELEFSNQLIKNHESKLLSD